MSSVIATFGFVDLAGFTALTEAHGDADAVAMLERFEATTTASLGDTGRLVKTIGDAVLLAFDEPTAAVTAVVSLFAAMQGTDLPVARGGLHHGAAVERNATPCAGCRCRVPPLLDGFATVTRSSGSAASGAPASSQPTPTGQLRPLAEDTRHGCPRFRSSKPTHF